MPTWMKIALALLIGVFIGAAGTATWSAYNTAKLRHAGHQAVFLINGQVFFGQVLDADSDTLTLGDVYYIRSEVNPETKQIKHTLIRRGNELHGPPKMIVSRRAILLIEPVGNESTVAKLIAQQRKQ
jgi:hypothetical protein